MKRYLMMTLLAVCLLLPVLSGTARAAEGGFTGGGTFVYRDVDGAVRTVIKAEVTLYPQSNQFIAYRGMIENGVLIPNTPIPYEPYKLNVSFTGWDGISCGSDSIEVNLQENTPLGTVELSLHGYPPISVYDPAGQQLGGITWSLLKDRTVVRSETSGAVEGAGSKYPNWDWNARFELPLDMERYQLRLEKPGYQTAVYDIALVLLEDGRAVLDGLDPGDLRMFPEGALVQPSPTNVRYAGGVVSWSARIVIPEEDETNRIHWCKIELTGANGESASDSISGDFGGTYDIFIENPDWPEGIYTAKITRLAQPHYTTCNSAPVVFRFYYSRPKGYLPSAENPGWQMEGEFPSMTWEYNSVLLGDVKEFRVTPRVCDTENGRYRDFLYEYLPDLQGSISVFPSWEGKYSPTQLLEAMRAYGEGWYIFNVSTVSKSAEWRDSDSVATSVPFHYVPDSKDPVKNGTMSATSSGGSVRWTLDNQSNILTAGKVPQGQGTVYVASYGANGRFLGVQTVQENNTLNLSRADSARMFWLENGTFKPMARASDVISRPEG